MTDPLAQGATRLLELLDRRALGAVELLELVLARIRAQDPAVGAFLAVDEEGARRAARLADRRRASGEPPGALGGLPVALKDNLCTAGLATTCSSRLLERFVPPYDAHVVERLRLAGAVIVGKTNLDEFGMGSSCEHAALGVTRNPWDLARVPGGSSGGSAAAVAAGMVPLALGSDTGGSIRFPAALTGLVGLKPTYGRVSRYGLVAFGSSLDVVGPLARNVRDCALLFEAVAGYDRRDSTSVPAEVPDCRSGLEQGVAGLVVGVPDEYWSSGLDPEVEAAARAALAVLERAGARLERVSLPHAGAAIPCYYLVATSEASANLARYDGVLYGRRADGPADVRELMARSRSEGLGPEVQRRILLGTFALSRGYHEAYYQKALAVRRLIREDFDRAFETKDLLVSPTSPFPAFERGSRLADPLAMYLCDVLTVGANLAGIPGLSLPCGLTGTGLPIGLQLLGPDLAEASLLAAARAIERECGLADRVAEPCPRAA